MNQLSAVDSELTQTPVDSCVGRSDICRPCVLLPLMQNASPLVRLQLAGLLKTIRPRRVVIECASTHVASAGNPLAVGVAGASGQLRFVAIVVDQVRPDSDESITIVGHEGGKLADVLAHEMVRPSLNLQNLRFEHEPSERVLDRLADAGVLARTILDRIHVCPQCGGLPIYRSVCRACHSSVVSRDELIHHFACAYVASVDRFRYGNFLRCPKCQMGPLIVGSDYEYLPGQHNCLECSQISSQLQLLGRCSLCHHDFLPEDSASQDLVGYLPNRLNVAELLSS